MTEQAATRHAIDAVLLEALGDSAEVYAVGGQVRDEVLAHLGRGTAVKPDFDYLVRLLPLESMLEALRRHGKADLVGTSFGVVKFSILNETVDIALPRRERSTGTGHRDFEVQAAPDVPLDEDLSRRDFRINMLARDLKSGALIDPFAGVEDLRERRLDILKDEVFGEDPLRILRGAQFAARFVVDRTREAQHRIAAREAARLRPVDAGEAQRLVGVQPAREALRARDVAVARSDPGLEHDVVLRAFRERRRRDERVGERSRTWIERLVRRRRRRRGWRSPPASWRPSRCGCRGGGGRQRCVRRRAAACSS